MGTSYGTVPQISLPASIYELRDYIKRKLGYPVVQVNVSDDQIYDRISDTLLYYRDYHYDGTQRTYVKWQVTQENIDNGWLPVTEDIIGIVRIFNPQVTESNKYTSIRYRLMSEIFLADTFGFTMPSFTDYVMTQQTMSEIDQLFRGSNQFVTTEMRTSSTLIWIGTTMSRLETGLLPRLTRYLTPNYTQAYSMKGLSLTPNYTQAYSMKGLSLTIRLPW